MATSTPSTQQLIEVPTAEELQQRLARALTEANLLRAQLRLAKRAEKEAASICRRTTEDARNDE